MEELVNRVFAAVQAKDLEYLMTLFADDAILIDPHFPEERMQGKTAIKEGQGGQVFVFEAAGGHVTRMQAYQPCGPSRIDRDVPPSLTSREKVRSKVTSFRRDPTLQHADRKSSTKMSRLSLLRFALSAGIAAL